MCACGGLVEAGALALLIGWLVKQRAKLKATPIAPPRLRDTLREEK